MNLLSNTMTASLLSNCKKLVPAVQFEEAGSFYWSPKKRVIFIDAARLDSEDGSWALVHEVAHALLEHQSYQNDAGLLMLEVAAWEKAREIGKSLALKIHEDHIQDCLNTYRDWLYARSTCPTCMLNSLQVDLTTYLCLNCATRWSVSGARFCRPYRLRQSTKNEALNQKQTRNKKSETAQSIFA